MLGFHWGIGRGQGRQPEPGTPSWAWLMVHLQASRKWLPTGSVHLQGAESWASHSWRNIQGGLAGREGEFITLKLKGNESSGLKRSRTVRGRGSLGLNFPWCSLVTVGLVLKATCCHWTCWLWTQANFYIPRLLFWCSCVPIILFLCVCRCVFFGADSSWLLSGSQRSLGPLPSKQRNCLHCVLWSGPGPLRPEVHCLPNPFYPEGFPMTCSPSSALVNWLIDWFIDG